MKKQTEPGKTSTAGGTPSRKTGSATPDLSVEAPSIGLLKAGEGIEKGYAAWAATLLKHVHHLPDLANAIRTKTDPDFNSLVIEEAKARKAEDETAMELFLAAVGAASLSAKQKETQQFEEAVKLKEIAVTRRSKYEENKRILLGKLFNTNTYISESLKIKLKNEMGIFSAESLIKEKIAEGSAFKIPITTKLSDGISKYDACVEIGDLLTLLKALEKSCRHLDGEIDILELKSKFYTWEPKENSTIERAFDDFEKLNRDLISCGVHIEEKERVAKLLLVLSKLPDLLPLLIDTREKVERRCGPETVADLMVIVISYVKHMNLIFRKSGEVANSGTKLPTFVNAAAHTKKSGQQTSTNSPKESPATTEAKPKTTCYNCGKGGHIAKNCRSATSGTPAGKATFGNEKGNNEKGNNGNKKTNETKQSETSDFFPKPPSKNKNGTGKPSANVAVTNGDIFDQFAFSTVVGNVRQTPRRVADSRTRRSTLGSATAIYDTGASIHIVNDRRLLYDVRGLNHPIHVKVASGDEVSASRGGIWKGIGSAILMPASTLNIVSHSQLVSNGGEVSFDSTSDVFTVYPGGRGSVGLHFKRSPRNLYECPLGIISSAPHLATNLLPAHLNVHFLGRFDGGPATPLLQPIATATEVIDLRTPPTTPDEDVVDLTTPPQSPAFDDRSTIYYDSNDDVPPLVPDSDSDYDSDDDIPPLVDGSDSDSDDDDYPLKTPPRASRPTAARIERSSPIEYIARKKNNDAAPATPADRAAAVDLSPIDDSNSPHDIIYQQPFELVEFSDEEAEKHGSQTAMAAIGEPNQRITRAQHTKLLETKALHEALGHPSAKRLKQTLSSGKLTDCHLTAQDVDLMYKVLGECEACLAGKTTNPPAPASESPKATKVGEVLHVDMAFTHGHGSSKVPNLIAVDEFSKYIVCVPLENKTQEHVQQALENILKFFARHGHHTRTIITDREPVFVAISKNFPVPIWMTATDAHVRVAERYIRHLKNMMRTILASLPHKLPHFLHPKLLEHCAHLHNFTATTHYHGSQSTPNESVTGTKPSLTQILDGKFGTIGMFTEPNLLENDDMAPRAKLGIIVGFEPDRPENRKVFILSNPRNQVVVRRTFKRVIPSQDAMDILNGKAQPDRFPILSTTNHEMVGDDDEDHDDTQPPLESTFAAINEDTDAVFSNELPNAAIDDGNLTIKQALQSLDKDSVVDAIFTELGNMEKHAVWRFIKSPKTFKPSVRRLPSKAFLKAKFDSKGIFTKLKLRVVAGGHRQDQASYGRTSAPTVDISSVFLILSLLTRRGGILATVDIPAAYLHAHLDEEILMTLPKDLSAFICSLDNSFESMLDKDGHLQVVLAKSLYGLKQAAHNWYNHLSAILIGMGFYKSSTDACVFFKTTGRRAIVAIHVDDILCLFQDRELLTSFQRAMEPHFGNLEFQSSDISFLGMNLRVLDNLDVYATQPGYANKICSLAGISSTAASPSTAELYSAEDSNDQDYSSRSPQFKSLLMSAMFLATRTRPDILKECVHLASSSLNPGPVAFRKLQRVFQYILGTRDLGVTFGSTSTRLALYCDASYAVHQNGRSHTGIIITMEGYSGPIVTKSHRQRLVTLSSTEAELVAVVDGIKRVLTLHALLTELSLAPPAPVLVYQDNKSTIHILMNGEGYSGKNRHMRVRFGFVSDLLKDETIQVEHLPTEEMIADLLTKPIGGNLFRRLRAMLLNSR